MRYIDGEQTGEVQTETPVEAVAQPEGEVAPEVQPDPEAVVGQPTEEVAQPEEVATEEGGDQNVSEN